MALPDLHFGLFSRVPARAGISDAESFDELMESTEWENYGHLNNPKCADCTAHCGYEATAVEDATSSLKGMLSSAKMIFS